MFTGIVEELGTVRLVQRDGDSAALGVSCSAVLDGTEVGDSISVNGCCVTVTAIGEDGFTADLMGETLDRTALSALEAGTPVNLERALPAGGRLGGHLVQGHVDGVGRIVAVDDRGSWTVMRISLPPRVAPYVAEKGSIAIDGVSLTVTAVDADAFEVGLIPHTLAVTTFGRARVGDPVNLEADVVAKYVERLLTYRPEGI
jgi:riboflavin synthase